MIMKTNLIKQNYKSGSENKIQRVTLAQTKPERILFSAGDEKSVFIIRSMGLPYVDKPFQISLFGSQVN